MRPPDFFTSRIIAAMRATLPSTRRSDETSLLMNAKPRRSRSRNSGVTRMPSCPQTIGSPALTSRSFRHAGASAGDDDDRVHALLLDLHPRPSEAHVRAVVGRRVEVVGHAAILLRRLRRARCARCTGWQPNVVSCCSRSSSTRRVGRRDAHLDARGVVVGAADVELQDLVGGLELDDLVEDRGQEARVDQVPSASIVSLAGMGCILWCHAVRFSWSSDAGFSRSGSQVGFRLRISVTCR